MRYTARRTVSLEHLEEDTNSHLVYTYTRLWSNGILRIELSPVDWKSPLLHISPTIPRPVGPVSRARTQTQEGVTRFDLCLVGSLYRMSRECISWWATVVVSSPSGPSLWSRTEKGEKV